MAMLSCMFVASILVAYAEDGRSADGLTVVSPERKEANASAFPTDEALLSSFRNNRAAFERLRGMVIEDAHAQPIFTENNIDNSLPEARRREYRVLLSSISSNLMVTVNYDRTVRFIFLLHGVSVIGPESIKGIEYAPKGARLGASLVQDLNDPERYTAGVYLKAIEPGWFVLFQKTD